MIRIFDVINSRFYILTCCIFLLNEIIAQGIAINNNGSAADDSAILDVSSSTKGMLAPRMTTSQRTGISFPATGLIVYDIDDNLYYQYDGGVWVDFEITSRGTAISDVPASPAVGDKYYDETSGLTYVYTSGGWASITQNTPVDSPYGTIDMVFGTTTGNSITILSWNVDVTSFDGYVILMNHENSFTNLGTNEMVYASTSYASNGEQVVFDGTNSTTINISIAAYESIYYFKMVPYSDGGSRVYDNTQSSVFVTTASCTYTSGTDTSTDEFEARNDDEDYEVYFNTVESQVCFSVDLINETITISSNQWPEHYMGDPTSSMFHISGKFPTAYVVANETTRELELNPTYDAMNGLTYVFSELGNTAKYDFYQFGIAVNGVEFHPMGVEPWAVLNASLEETGEENWEWQVRVVFEDDVNLDPYGGHTTSRGEYHYHGDVTELADEDGSSHSKIYGFAADGFPIYYKYGYTNANDPTSSIKELTSSYQLRSGSRSTHPNVIASGGTAGQDYPDGNFDGTYIQDYEYVSGLGDLDECNGRQGVTPEYPDGTYYYVLTSDFPITPNCFVGNPKDDFIIGK